MKTALTTLLAITATTLGLTASLALAGDHGQDKVTLCHAAGLAGTTQYITITVGYPAAYGPAGHFQENGTPNAGHEQDYLGPCQGDPTVPDDTTPTTTTPTTTTPTTTTPTVPDTPRCPPGMFPTNGKDGEPGNDECEYPPTPTVPSVTTTPAATVTTTTPTTTTTTPTVTVTTPAANSPQPKTPAPKAKAPKPAAKPKPKAPKLTGNPKTDKCKPKGNGLMNCGGVTVVPGSG